MVLFIPFERDVPKQKPLRRLWIVNDIREVRFAYKFWKQIADFQTISGIIIFRVNFESGRNQTQSHSLLALQCRLVPANEHSLQDQ